MIYLDHSATTPIDSRVEAVMERLRREVSGNPGSVHRVGQRARVQVAEDSTFLTDTIYLVRHAERTKGKTLPSRRRAGKGQVLCTAC